MSRSDPLSVRVSAQNIGGIDETSLTVDQPVTLLVGQNATNRTSLLSALAAGLGGSPPRLKSDADEGRVTLELDGTTYERRFTRDRTGQVVVASGEPVTSETTLVDNFVRLLADNPARRAVEHDGDLREILMDPVDTAAIEREIAATREDLSSVEQEIEQIERERERLPELTERRTSLQTKLEDVTEELEAAQEAVEAYDASPEEAEAAADLVEELETARQRQKRLGDRIETQRESIEALRADRETVSADLADVESRIDDEALQDLEQDRDRLQTRKRTLEETVADLVPIVEFNETRLSEEMGDRLQHASDGQSPADRDGSSRSKAADSVTAELLSDDRAEQEVECWTCGQRVDRATIQNRVEELRSVISEKRAEIADLDDRIETLRDRQREFEAARERRADLQDRLERIDTELEDRVATVEELQADREAVQARIDDLETRIEETEELRNSDLLDRHRAVSDLEYERGRLESDLSTVEDEIADIEAAVATLEDLEHRRDQLKTELADLRERVQTLETDAVDAFNEHMDALLTRLEYDRLERVWLDRVGSNGTEPSSTGGAFELHVVRTNDSGAVYEDDVATLSESERAVVGLVFALAGHLVHDVADEVPVVLLDSLEAIDASRIERLLSYVASLVPHVVVALLPEDAADLPSEYARIDVTNEQ